MSGDGRRLLDRAGTGSWVRDAGIAFLCVLTAALGGCTEQGGGSRRVQQAGAAASTKKAKGSRRHGLTPQQAAKVLVKVGDTTITLGEFAERLAEQSPYLRARYGSPERRKELLQDMVRFELLALEAERRGLGKLPEVREAVEQAMVQRMMQDLFAHRFTPADVTAEEIKAYYEAHEEEFHRPAYARVSHILVRERALAERLIAELQQASPRMERFRQLVQRYSLDEESKVRGGDLGFFPKPGEGELPERVPEPVARAAFELQRVGDVVAEPVRSDRGWHVVMLTGRRAPVHRTLQEAERVIRNRLWRDKRDEAIRQFVQKLRERAGVQIYEDRLQLVRIDGQAPRSSEASAAAGEGGERAATRSQGSPSEAARPLPASRSSVPRRGAGTGRREGRPEGGASSP